MYSDGIGWFKYCLPQSRVASLASSYRDKFGTPVSHGIFHHLPHSAPNENGMSSSLILLATSSVAIICYVLKFSSPWLIIPIYLAVFLGWNGYRILIYQRYLNPLSRLPGPRVSLLLQVITVGTLALGRVSNPPAGRTWTSTSPMAPAISQSYRICHISWIILHPSSHADI